MVDNDYHERFHITIMGSTRKIVFTFVLFLSLLSTTAAQNNVCKTLDDYMTPWNDSRCWYDPDVAASPFKEQLVRRHGYNFERHVVLSEDGFLLTLFRVYGGAHKKDATRAPVLLHHGIVVDGISWMMIGKRSPAFILADNGFDVWIMNARGTLYSTKNWKYGIYSTKYWDFSFHEMGYIDLPKVIEYIESATRIKGQLILMGSSMGSTASLVYATTRPQHAHKHVKKIVCLAPVAFMDYARSVTKFVSNYRLEIKKALSRLGLLGVGSNLSLIIGLGRSLCSTYPYMVFCEVLVHVITGPGSISPENLPVIFSQALSGMSIKTMEHFAQILTAKGKFQMFDYGLFGNVKAYNSSTPPEYKLSKVKVPVSLYYGKNDFLADEKDVTSLYEQIQGEKVMKKVIFDDGSDYSHIDFFVGKESERFFKSLVEDLMAERADL